jgi:plasmid stabilization system protein ParE
MRVAFDRDALEQLKQITRWWSEHGGSAALFDRELTKTLDVLSEFPDAGSPAEHVAVGVRQYPLRRSRYQIYYDAPPRGGATELRSGGATRVDCEVPTE